MGIKVTATLDDDLKPDYVVTTVLAASFTLADSALAIWIGNAHTMTKVEELSALENCNAFIRENGTETPVAAEESYAEASNMMGISKRQLQRVLSDQDIEINYISPRCPRLTLTTIEELIQRRTISSN